MQHLVIDRADTALSDTCLLPCLLRFEINTVLMLKTCLSLFVLGIFASQQIHILLCPTANIFRVDLDSKWVSLRNPITLGLADSADQVRKGGASSHVGSREALLSFHGLYQLSARVPEIDGPAQFREKPPLSPLTLTVDSPFASAGQTMGPVAFEQSLTALSTRAARGFS